MSSHDLTGLEDLGVDPAALAELCERYGISELSVFGSAARGEATIESDIDLLYVLGPDARLGWKINDLSDELEAVFGRPVDLVSKRGLHRRLREAALRDARVVYAA